MLDFSSGKSNAHAPQLGRSNELKMALDSLGVQEEKKLNRIIEDHYKEKNKSILDKSLGEVINNTVNFFSNSLESYSLKLVESEALLRLHNKEYGFLTSMQKYVMALILFIRDDENVIYLGIILVTLSFLICFLNISRRNGYNQSITQP